MASALLDSLTAVVDALKTAGIDATLDAREINPPCAWVTVHDVIGAYLCGDLQVRADVCLIVGDFGGPLALAALGDLLDKAATVITFDEPARPATLAPPGMAPTPALVITTSTD